MKFWGEKTTGGVKFSVINLNLEFVIFSAVEISQVVEADVDDSDV